VAGHWLLNAQVQIQSQGCPHETVVYKVAVGWDFLQTLQFPLPTIILPIPQTDHTTGHGTKRLSHHIQRTLFSYHLHVNLKPNTHTAQSILT